MDPPKGGSGDVKKPSIPRPSGLPTLRKPTASVPSTASSTENLQPIPSGLSKENSNLSTSINKAEADRVLTADTDSFIIGDTVWVGGTKRGRIAFIGDTQFAKGEWAGVVLDEAAGKNDGMVNGVRYFQCDPLHGTFTRLTRLSRFPLVPVDPSQCEVHGATPPRYLFERQRSPSPLASATSGGFTTPLRTGSPVSPGSASAAGPLKIGDRVIVQSSTSGTKRGVLRFLGKTEFAEGEWAGIELDHALGKNDGSVQGKRYFTCPPKHGLFSPVSKVSSSPANKRPSSVRRFGSKESLVSNISSIMSSVSRNVPVNRSARKPITSHLSPPMLLKSTNKCLPTCSLQSAIREMEIHLDQLIQEKEIDRQELVQLNNLLAQKNQRRSSTNMQNEDMDLLRSEVDRYKDALQVQKHANEGHLSKIDDLTRKMDDLQFSYEEEKIFHNDLQSQIQSGRKDSGDHEEMARLCAELLERTVTQSKMDQELTSLRTKLSAAESEAASVSKLVEDLKAKQTQELNALRAQAANYEQTQAKIEFELKEAQISKEEAEEELKSALAKLLAVDGLKDAAQSEFEQKYKNLQLESSSLLNVQEALEAQLNQKTKEFDDLSTKVEELEAQVLISSQTELVTKAQQEVEVKVLTATVQKYREDGAVLKQTLEIAQAQLAQKVAVVSDLQAQRDSESQSKSLTEATLSEREAQVNDLQKDLKSLKENEGNLQENLSEAQQALKEDEAQKNAFKAEIEALMAKEAELQKKLEESFQQATTGESTALGQIASLQVLLDETTKKLQEAEDKGDKQMEDIAFLKKQVSDGAEKEQEAAAASEAQLASVKSLLEESQQMLVEALANKKGLDEELTLIKSDFKELEQSREYLKADLELSQSVEKATTVELTGLKGQIASVQSLLDETSKKLQEKEVESQQILDASATLKKTEEELRVSLEQTQTDSEDRLASIHKLLDDSKRQLAEAQAKEKALTDSKTTVESDLAAINTCFKEVERSRDSFQKQLLEASQITVDTSTASQQQLASVRLLLDETEKRLHEVEAKLESTTGLAKAEAEKKASLEQQLAEVCQSAEKLETTWRSEVAALQEQLNESSRREEDLNEKMNQVIIASKESEAQLQQKLDVLVLKVKAQESTASQEIAKVQSLLEEATKKLEEAEAKVLERAKDLEEFKASKEKQVLDDALKEQEVAAAAEAQIASVQSLLDESKQMVEESRANEKSLIEKLALIEANMNELHGSRESLKAELLDVHSAKKMSTEESDALRGNLSSVQALLAETIKKLEIAEVKEQENAKALLELQASMEKQLLEGVVKEQDVTAASEAQIASAQLLLDDSKQSLDEARTNENALTEELLTMKSSLQDLERSRDSLKAQLLEVQSIEKATTEEATDLKRQLASVQLLLDDTTKKLQESETTKQQIMHEASAASQKAEEELSLSASLQTAFDKRLAALQLLIDESKHKLDEAETREQTTAQLKSLLEAELAGTKSSFAALERTKASLEKQVQETSQVLASSTVSEQQIASVESLLAETEKRLHEAEAQWATTTVAVKSEAEMKASLEKQLAEAIQSLEELRETAQSEVTAYQEQLEDRLRQQVELDQEIMAANEKYMKMERILKEREAEREFLQKQLEIQGSLELDSKSSSLKITKIEESYGKKVRELEEALRKSKNSNTPQPTGDQGLDVSFLNSIIVDLQRKNEELNQKVEFLMTGNTLSDHNRNTFDSSFGSTNSTLANARLYCDICEEFDLHDTSDCPTQCAGAEDPESTNSHFHEARGATRKYCTVCEVFGHDTEECDEETY